MSETYRVVAEGLAAGVDRRLAAQQLETMLTATRAQIESLLAQADSVIKEGLALDAANNFRAALTGIGVCSRVESETSQASNPGRIVLSMPMLEALQPELSDPAFWVDKPHYPRDTFLEHLTHGLFNSDARAAVVMDAAAGLVAAYSDDFDCAVMLRFEPVHLTARGWKQGTRLLTVNMYQLASVFVAPDLTVPEGVTTYWGNFWPLIADLLTDDPASLAATKGKIPEDEWQRAHELGLQLLRHGAMTPRDGRPFGSFNPGVAIPPEDAARIEAPVAIRSTPAARPLAIALACLALAGWAAMNAGPAGFDLAFGIDCLSVLALAGLGLFNARKAYTSMRSTT